ncbi:MAG: iron-sulfur cluster assembly scaffold protein [Candidatus Peribacteria bacterium]|nr:MAG: iron-sulfur cluster assembly scaffold protein [Candidatus Peribacteria bacterium]
MASPTISYEQGNNVCGDNCIVYLRIDGDRISEFSHMGQPSMHTLAAASMLAEQIEGKELIEVLSW